MYLAEWPKGATLICFYGDGTQALGKAGLFVVIPKGRHNWHKRIYPAMKGYMSRLVGKPFQKKNRLRGGYDILISGNTDETENAERYLESANASRLTSFLWTRYNPETRILEEIEFPPAEKEV